jgi:hypothetical protein
VAKKKRAARKRRAIDYDDENVHLADVPPQSKAARNLIYRDGRGQLSPDDEALANELISRKAKEIRRARGVVDDD